VLSKAASRRKVNKRNDEDCHVKIRQRKISIVVYERNLNTREEREKRREKEI
tara:strand:+ start:473 stop:628 length:156 start_codon:yes stop_codon:yes gene_type:complete